MVDRQAEIQKPAGSDGAILESWAQGFMVGALLIMAAITISNMRRGVVLHKLILIELCFGMPHGTFMFPKPPVYGWYLSVTAIFLNISWVMHNIIAWLKNKPFLSKKVSMFYIGTVLLSIPYWIVEIYANFTYFNNINNLFHYTRPYEAIFRDPWWIFTTCSLFWNIVRRYEFGIVELIRVSPRFGVLLGAMLLSVGFIVVDICSVTKAIQSSLPEGINPFWKLAFVFKCLTDTIILDDFKTALDRLKDYKLRHMNSHTISSDEHRSQSRPHHMRNLTAPYNEARGVTRDEKLPTYEAWHTEAKDSSRNNSASSHNAILENDQGQNDFSHIDLEMQYWNSSSSRDRRSRQDE
ncbi:uncharacterized protein PV09_06187 [Verruconis gallopava]|uniref:Uncharacterized protein n=1 Tax=Verruconis gallopava TaxID=253628 RepID=A0A0D2A6Z6_9PEZI|nr:uncharacterized protein PV09_06187 [Verruconis gallopava]KIW02365.1 hypothetical protein PV09_06187 [Verruconis gallopava]